jgi:hypothetical protein
MLIFATMCVTPTAAQVQIGKPLLDQYADLRRDAAEILRSRSAGGICSSDECCVQWYLLLRRQISPWYARQSDFQHSLGAIEQKSKTQQTVRSSDTGMLVNLDTAQNELYLAISTLASDCDRSVARCHMGVADRAARAAVLFEKGRIEAAQRASDAASDYADRCGLAEHRCSCAR